MCWFKIVFNIFCCHCDFWFKYSFEKKCCFLIYRHLAFCFSFCSLPKIVVIFSQCAVLCFFFINLFITSIPPLTRSPCSILLHCNLGWNTNFYRSHHLILIKFWPYLNRKIQYDRKNQAWKNHPLILIFSSSSVPRISECTCSIDS